jgi:glycosyltransferase involved in cell wall biosynthesis
MVPERRRDPRILMIGTYPIRRPTFGGPRRSRAIFDALRGRFATVEYIAVHPRPGAGTGPRDIAVSWHVQRAIDDAPFLADVLAGEAIYGDPATRVRVERRIRDLRPDVIVVQSLFPFLGLGPLLADIGTRSRIVYSSENVEHRMKEQMYESFEMAAASRERLVARLTTAERDLAVQSDLVAAVTTDDRDAFEGMGATAILAPHGAWPLQPSKGAVEGHVKWLSSHRIRRTAVFISSAHQPNWQGFLDMVGTRLGFVPFGSRIVIAGSIGDLAGPPPSRPTESATFWLRSIRSGLVSDDRMAAILLSAHVVLLPITTGGGSNLKTAEALASGRPVVATPYAFRGYEEFGHWPNVHLAEDPDTFRLATVQALETARRTDSQPNVPAALTWGERLRPLLEAVERL